MALSLFVWLAYSIYRETIRARDRVSHAYGLIATLNALHSSIVGAETLTHHYLLTGQEGYIVEQGRVKKRLDSLLTVLRQMTAGDPLQGPRVDTLGYLAGAQLATDEVLQRPDTTGRRRAGALTHDSINRRIESVYASLIDTENLRFRHRSSENRRIIRNAYYVALLGSVLFLTLLALSLARIRRILQLQRQAASLERETREAQYRTLIENARVVMFNTDLEGHFLFISDWVFPLTGFHKEELVGRHFSLLVAPDALEEVSGHYRIQLELNMKESELEFPIVMKNGARRWVSQMGVLVHDAEGRPTGFQCIVRDIDEQKRMQLEMQSLERRRREYQQLLQAILDNSPSLIFMKDQDCKYLLVNRKYEEIFQLQARDIIGKEDGELEPEERARRSREEDEWVLKHREMKRVVHVLHTPAGPRSYLVLKFPIANERGEIRGLCGIATDISDQIHREKELERAREKAEIAEKSQEQFLASVSHEMRTPLNGIVGMSRLLAETALQPRQADFVQTLQESAETLLLLINDLLDISRIKAGRMTFEKLTFDVRALFARTLNGLQVRAREKGLALTQEVDPAVPPFLEGDPHRLNQVLVNLLDNALKFTDKGAVRLHAFLERHASHKIWLRMEVSDTGIGIPPERQGELFREFVQLQPDTARRYGGSGLGLALTRWLVQDQGGQMSVRSSPGKGTTFIVIIPYGIGSADGVAHASVAMDKEKRATALQGLSILVAEDNLINRKVAMHTLEQAGARVTVAADGQEAVALLREGLSPDLVLMDLMMPEMDGYAATRIIRGELGLRLPIIAMTAANISTERDKALAAGMDGYVAKPFVPGELFILIRNLLSGVKENPATPDAAPPPPAAEEDRGTPSYSLALLEELEDESHTREMLQMFLNTTPRQLQGLEDAITRADWETVYQEAHRLKASLGLLQMQDVLAPVRRIEQSAKDGQQRSLMVAWMAAARSAYEAAEAQLRAEARRRGA